MVMYLLLWLLVPNVYAQSLIVIYDSGQTFSIAPYLEPISVTPTERPWLNKKSTPPIVQPSDQWNWSAYLPIQTLQMQPGPLPTFQLTPKQRTLLSRLSPPLFLIGADDISQRWLQQNRLSLQRLGAIGLLVQADTAADIQHLQTLAQGLLLIPASATTLVPVFGLSHYPVLLSAQGIQQ